MQVTPIKPVNLNKRQKVSNAYSVNFERRMYLVPIRTDSFEKESSKILYSKIHKYLKLIEDGGKIENVKVMRDKWINGNYYTNKNPHFYEEADIYLSMNKNEKNTTIRLSREVPNSSDKTIFFETLFNNNGQMIQGSLNIENYLNFERSGSNIRRISNPSGTYLPLATNDRVWKSLIGTRFYSSSADWVYGPIKEDNSAGGAFEIFIEFARHSTSIFK